MLHWPLGWEQEMETRGTGSLKTLTAAAREMGEWWLGESLGVANKPLMGHIGQQLNSPDVN